MTATVYVRLVSLAIVVLAFFFESKACALTVTAVTSDNGYPAHLVSWTDASGNPRSAVMVDENSNGSGPYTGYMRQYTYLVSGVPRVCTGTTTYTNGGLETSGEGFIQLHSPYYPYDISSGNGAGCPGATFISPSSGTMSHVTITYSMQQLTAADGSSYTLPTTVQWFFADGRNDPIFAVNHDATSYVNSNTADLGFDTVSPYGDMSYAGASGDPLVGGFSYGDQYKFVTLASGPEEVTLNSGWKDTTANIIPYTMQWTEPATANAEMGNVATIPLFVGDAGQDTQTPNSDLDVYTDYRKESATGGPFAASSEQAYQIVPYQMLTLGLSTSATDAKRLTWGSNYGRVGGFDEYNTYPNQDGTINTYPMHSDDLAPDSQYNLSSYLAHGSGQYSPSTQSFSGSSASGAIASYSVFMVFGLHYGGGGNVVGSSYLTGAVGTMVTQMENMAQAALSASNGSVVTSGPSGLGPAAPQSVTYTPAGYNPIYSTWELTASQNAVTATLTPATGKSLTNPIFLVDNYSSSHLPTSISINGSTAGSGYYATVDTAGQRLWITARVTGSSAIRLIVTAPPYGTSSNTSTGYQALSSNTSGSANTADGNQALLTNTTGYDNTAVGCYSLYYNTTGSSNTAEGYAALLNNTTGASNTANGDYALEFNTTGTGNTANGLASLLQNRAGSNNTANGYVSLLNNTSGGDNTANGTYALDSNTSGSGSTADGYAALGNSTGSSNTGDGSYALFYNTSGVNNIAIGNAAGSAITTGSNNIDIGSTGSNGDSNVIHLGTQGTQGQAYVAGIFGVTAGGGVPVYVTSNGQLGTLTSSAKFKKNIQDMGSSSDALMALRPVTFQYKSKIDPTGTPQFGLIAEEVEKVSPDLVVHDANHQIYTVRYEAVNAMLLNEFQKQQQVIAEHKKTMEDQQRVVAEHKESLDAQQKALDAQQKIIGDLTSQVNQMEQSEDKK